MSEGTLGIGRNRLGEVVVHLPPELIWRFSNVDGGNLVFTPTEAREFASLIVKQADLAEGKSPDADEQAEAPAPPVAQEAAAPSPEADPPPDPRRYDYSDGFAFPYQWMDEGGAT